MQIVWQRQAAVIREIIEDFPEPKPHYNTLATIVKILVEKGFLTAERVGNTDQYRPAVDFESYRDEDLQQIKQKYFGNSLPKMMAHFAKSEKLSEEEREELIRLINSQKD